jgi:hypothetical protein
VLLELQLLRWGVLTSSCWALKTRLLLLLLLLLLVAVVVVSQASAWT